MLAQPVGHRVGIAYPGRREGLGEMGDDRGIEPVGLGEPAAGAGELANLARIDHGGDQPRLAQRQPQRPFVPARRLQHDPFAAQRPQPADQGIVAGPVVADRKADPERAHMHVQTVLRNIDPYKNRRAHHHPIPFLRLRARAPATVRA